MIPGGSIINPTIKLPEGCEIAYTSNGGDYNCVVTPSYDTYTYQLGAQAAETFYWNVPAEGEDQVNIDKVVTLASKEGVYSYEWAQNDNAFTTVLKKEFTFRAQSTLTLEEDFTYKLYIPVQQITDLGADITVLANGEELNAESIVNKGGVDYYVVEKEMKPTEATKAAVSLDVTLNGAYGDSIAAVDADLSMLGYVEDILEQYAEDANVIDLMNSILNYFAAAYAYAGEEVDEAVANLLGEDYAPKYVIEGEAKYSKPDGVTSASVFYGATVGWSLLAEPGATVTVAYGDVEKTYTAPASGVINVTIPGQYLAQGISVNNTVINLQGYYAALGENAAAQDMVSAIYNYSCAAAVYAAAKAN